jgi:hypothetical protein
MWHSIRRCKGRIAGDLLAVAQGAAVALAHLRVLRVLRFPWPEAAGTATIRHRISKATGKRKTRKGPQKGANGRLVRTLCLRHETTHNVDFAWRARVTPSGEHAL